MSKQIEALKLALEALKELRMLGMNAQWHDSWLAKPNEAITAIREALAEQPAKEKAPQSANCEAPGWIISDHARRNNCTTEQPYPDNFIDALKYDVAKRDSEALAEQPAQHPVAVVKALPMGHNQTDMHYAEFQHLPVGTLLYTSPPASKPLTDEEIWDEVKAADLDWQTGWSLDEDAANRYIIFARAIEAKHGIKENT